MIETLHMLQARISVLESLAAELVARHNEAHAIVESMESGWATQHALQISNGTSEGFVAAFREAQTQLLHELKMRLHVPPDGAK